MSCARCRTAPCPLAYRKTDSRRCSRGACTSWTSRWACLLACAPHRSGLCRQGSRTPATATYTRYFHTPWSARSPSPESCVSCSIVPSRPEGRTIGMREHTLLTHHSKTYWQFLWVQYYECYHNKIVQATTALSTATLPTTGAVAGQFSAEHFLDFTLTIFSSLWYPQKRPRPPSKSKAGLTEGQPSCSHLLCFTSTMSGSLWTTQYFPFPPGKSNSGFVLHPLCAQICSQWDTVNYR